MTEYSFSGVQLLPNNEYAYRQRTYTNNGIEIEESTVIVRDICGNELEDVTDYFTVTNNFQDPNTGFPQLYWELQNVPFDFGYRLIYLEIQGGANGLIYSSPFMLTADRGEYTTQFFYKQPSTPYMLSIGLQLFYRQKKSDVEMTAYIPVANGVQYTAGIKLLKYERCYFDIVEVGVIEAFKEMFLCPIVYGAYQNFEEQPVLTQLKEAVESPDLEADENFAEAEVMLIRDYSQIYDPNAVPVTPPGPSPENPFINLTSVVRLTSTTVNLYFDYGNFSPTYLTGQYSLDGVEWISNTGDTSSPKLMGTGDNIVNNYYYRVFHQGTETASNVLQITAQAIFIDGVTQAGTRQWWVNFNSTFAPTAGRLYEFQASNNDGTSWGKIITDYNNNNPKLIELPLASPAFDRIRIKYDNIISNTFILPT